MIEHVPVTAYRTMPWKNGGGVTHEIAAEAGTPPLWRLSVATIDRDGPFSDFSGYDRTIVALDGSVELTCNASSFALTPLTPFIFRGEDSVTCRIAAGPARDFNVMTARDAFMHDVEIVNGRSVFLVDDDELVFVYLAQGNARVDSVACVAGETVYLDSVERIEIVAEPGARVCVVRITPR